MNLTDLARSLRNCQRCQLAHGRTQVVFGTGNPQARIMFVGEAPGFYEDKQGEPFVGAAGKLLTDLLHSVGLSRSEIYIANVIKCRPPNNRDPLPEEIDTCKPFLLQQIELINPKLVCTLGNFATQTLLGKKVGITKVRGRAIRMPNFVVFPLLHPAAALHQGSLRKPLEEDFQKLKAVLDDMQAGHFDDPPTAPVTPQKAPQTESAPQPLQMELF
ncbi:MAG: uracil-DNA glycosylase [Nitrospirae bacterium]|nr:MAG: uracil-DNA glycosylase [Nitrospirota bacterium]